MKGKSPSPANRPASNGPGAPSILDGVRAEMLDEYRQEHCYPWVVAYSGGKDSTLVMQLVFELLLSLPRKERKREVHIASNDTLVESPLVIEHLKKSLQSIRQAAQKKKLPVFATLTEPCVDDTFWVNVIGRGYIPPTRSFRWCTDRMKIRPANHYINRLVKTHGGAILLIGTRKSESANRRRNIERREKANGRLNPHAQIENCHMFTPIADLDDDDVWLELMDATPPWGGTHQELVTLYRNALGGECPVVLSKADVPSCGTTSPRFGCWTCTVVQKDRSLEGLVESGFEIFEPLMKFRDWLQALREDNNNRMNVRRDGSTKYRNGNRVYGPFKMEVRKKILEKLQQLESQTGRELISRDEMIIIHDVWDRDSAVYETRDALFRMMRGQVAA